MYVVGLENGQYVAIVGGHSNNPLKVYEMNFPEDAEIYHSREEAHTLAEQINSGIIQSECRADFIQLMTLKPTNKVEWIKHETE